MRRPSVVARLACVVLVLAAAGMWPAAAGLSAPAAQAEPDPSRLLALLEETPFPQDELPQRFGDATVEPMPDEELSPNAFGAVEVVFDLPALHEIDYVVYAGLGGALLDVYRVGLELPAGWEAEPTDELDRPALLITGELEGHSVGLVTFRVGLVVVGAWSAVEGTDDTESTANALAIAAAALAHLETLMAEATADGGDEPAPAGDLDGTWAGETEEGESFEVDVRDGRVTAVRFAYRCGGGRHFITVLESAPIVDGQFLFEYTGSFFAATVTGTFTADTAEGTLEISEDDGCGATLAWTASPGADA